MRASPAVMLYLKIKEAIQLSGQPTLGFTVAAIADLITPNGSQNEWVMRNVAKELSLIIPMARDEGILVSPTNKLYFQVFPQGGGPNTLAGAFPFVARGGKDKGTFGIVFEAEGHWIFKASQTETWQKLAVALVNKREEFKSYEQRGWLQAGEIEQLSRDEYLRLKQ